MTTAAATAVKLDGVELPKGPYAVMGFSAQGEVSGPMVVAGYGGNNLWTHYEMIYLHGSSDFASWRDAR